MSIIVPDTPKWLQEGVYPARLDRQVLDAIWTEGILDGLTVTQRAAGANLSVDVAKGRAVINGDNQADQGAYLTGLTGTENLEIGVPAAQPRIDLIVLRINDTEAGGPVGNNGTIEVVPGVPATTPVVPTLPSSAIELARVSVAVAAASITNANINSTARVFAMPYAGGSPRGLIGQGVSTANATATTTTPVTLPGATFNITVGPGRRRLYVAVAARYEAAVADTIGRITATINGVQAGNYHQWHAARASVLQTIAGGGFMDHNEGTYACAMNVLRVSGGTNAIAVAGTTMMVMDFGPSNAPFTAPTILAEPAP